MKFWFNPCLDSKPRQHRIIYSYARVHTPAKPLLCGELDLRIGDYITELEHTNDPGMWKVIKLCLFHKKRGKVKYFILQQSPAKLRTCIFYNSHQLS